MKKQITKYYIVFLLLTVFAAPGIAAYLFFKHPNWLSSARTNKGALLTQSVELKSVEGRNKWRLLFWTPSTCEQDCLKQIDTLARVRLALGRKLYLVELQLMMGIMQPENIAAISPELTAKDFQVSSLTLADRKQLEQLSTKPQIFIMSPDNYLVLSYSAGTKPGDVYKDLKTLINATEIKG